MVIEFGMPASESPAKISKFYNPTNSEHKIHKTRIQNWLSIFFEQEYPWQRNYSHNHYTMLTYGMMGLLHTHLQS